jgi:drug/metabolite transporter (DMT)-like permease
MSNEVGNNDNNKAREYFFIIVIILAVIECGVIMLGFYSLNKYMPGAIAILGVITFFGMIMIGYIQSTSIKTGEVRRAIAGTATVVYFTLLAVIAFTDLGPTGEEKTWILHDFTVIYGIIIGFYFGSRATEDFAKRKYK